MLTPYEHPWYIQLQKQENITNLESQLEQRRSRGIVGQTLTDPSFKGDLYEHIVIVEAMKRGAHVYKNVGCTGKTDMIIEKNGEKISIDVKASTRKQASGPNIFLVTVDVDTLQVKWGNKRRQPTNWKDFWS